MGILDDTAIFTAVIQQGGFSHAARHLGLSNGLISRRIAALETSLSVTLLKRTTRQLRLTPEGELFWQHAQRIQQEMDSAISLIQSSAKKPKGMIRVSAPLYFGRHYLTPIIMKFLADFPDIKVDLILTNQRLDPIKEQMDLVIRGSGFVDNTALRDSSMKMKLFIKEQIGLYVSSEYLMRHGDPETIDELSEHIIIGHSGSKQLHDVEKWSYTTGGKKSVISVIPNFKSNDIESGLIACAAGYGVGKFTDLNVKQILLTNDVRQILTDVDWGSYHLYAVYPQQKSLPRRTRLLLDFITAHIKNLQNKVSDLS